MAKKSTTFANAEAVFLSNDNTLKEKFDDALHRIDENPNKKEKESLSILCTEINKKIKENGGSISRNEIDSIFEKINKETFQREIRGIKNTVLSLIKNSFTDDEKDLIDPEKEEKTSEIYIDPHMKNTIKNIPNLQKKMDPDHIDFSVSEDGETLTFIHNGFIDTVMEDYFLERIMSSEKTQKVQNILFEKPKMPPSINDN